MSRRTALRIFGLDESASDAAVWAAYSSLSAHLKSRARAAEAMERVGALAFYREQLHELDTALELATGTKSKIATAADSPDADRARATKNAKSGKNPRRWMPLAIALLAGFAFLVIALDAGLTSIATREAGVGPATLADLSPEALGEPPQVSAQLRLRGDLAGAVAQVIDKTSGEIVWQGPADGRSLELSQGDYALSVEHPQCPDRWDEEIQLAAGQQVDRLAQNCRQHGLLAVRANVDGARVSIDGRDAGPPDGDATALPVGSHRIRVVREGHETWDASIDLASASRVSLKANLVPSAEVPTTTATPPVPAAPPVASASPRSRSSEQAPEREADRRTHEWHSDAKEYLLARYDKDQSGWLDSLAEIQAIPCSDWRGLEQSFDGGGLALSMTRFYGFDGSKWVEDAFGVTNEMRGQAYLELKDCGLR